MKIAFYRELVLAGMILGMSGCSTVRSEVNEDIMLERQEETGERYNDEVYCLAKLEEHGLLQDDVFVLTGWHVGDFDGNGQKDVIAVVSGQEDYWGYGKGAIYVCMNEDQPYCYENENCCFGGWSELATGDIDNDGYAEIMLLEHGTGVGGPGDTTKIVLKYGDDGIREMELPSDFESDIDRGIRIETTMENEPDTYSAYCPMLDEIITFEAENSMPDYLKDALMAAGGQCRGYYDLQCVTWQGANALQATEYLYGEGGIVHYIGSAVFIITWDGEGNAEIVDWWVEPG